MKKVLLNIAQFALFLSIGAVILYLVYRHQNMAYLEECSLRNIPAEQCSLIDKLLTDFTKVRFEWIGLILCTFILSNVHRTLKWNMLLRPMGFRPRFINGFLSILVGYFANLGLPRMGEVVRAGLLSKYEFVPVEKAFGTIVVDRIVDVLCLGFVFGLALVFEYEKLWGYLAQYSATTTPGEAGGINWKWILPGAFVIGGVLLYVFRKKLADSFLFQKFAKVLTGFLEGIQTVRQLEKPGWFIFHSISIFFCYFLMTWFGFQAFAPTEHLDIRAALTVFAFGTLGMVIPSPGGMGTFHALVIACLTLFYGIKGDDAFSVANIIFFTVSIGFNVVLGLTSLILLPLLNSKRA